MDFSIPFPFCNLLGTHRPRQRLAFELLFERIEQRNGVISAEDLTLRSWGRWLFPALCVAVEGRGAPDDGERNEKP